MLAKTIRHPYRCGGLAGEVVKKRDLLNHSDSELLICFDSSFYSLELFFLKDKNSPGAGDTTPFTLYEPSQRLGFLRHFSLKTGIDFANFGLESGMVLCRELREFMNIFVVLIPMNFMDFKKSF